MLVGMLIGILVTSLFFWNPWTGRGVLRIDHSNPDKDSYLFEIDDLDKLRNKSRVILKIDHHADLSQK